MWPWLLSGQPVQGAGLDLPCPCLSHADAQVLVRGHGGLTLPRDTLTGTCCLGRLHGLGPGLTLCSGSRVIGKPKPPQSQLVRTTVSEATTLQPLPSERPVLRSSGDRPLGRALAGEGRGWGHPETCSSAVLLHFWPTPSLHVPETVHVAAGM